jgi:CBS domain-containing protein
VTIAHGFTVLTLRRSILTEKVARRGYHLSREYQVDPLEVLLVRDVMRTNIVALPAGTTGAELAQSLHADPHRRGQTLYPVVDKERQLVGAITRRNLQRLVEDSAAGPQPLARLAHTEPAVAYADEPLRMVVYRMADSGLTRFPVVERGASRQLMGMVSLHDLLRARTRALEEERHRERVLRIRLPFGARSPATASQPQDPR